MNTRIDIPKVVSLNSQFSTTKRLTTVAPTIPDSNSPVNSYLRLPAANGRKGEGGLRARHYFKVPAPTLSSAATSDRPPLITVITVVFNSADALDRTIMSVLNQTYENVEYIVIDGGSLDGSLEIIRAHEDAIDYWVSEPDGGIYHAMNKGISLASGNFIALLNASDWYASELLDNVVGAIGNSATNDRCIIYSNYQLYDEDLNVFEKRQCSVRPWRGMTISHQAMFIGSTVYRELGNYNLDYRLAADFNFFLRAFRANVAFVQLDSYGVFFRTGGRSLKNMPLSIREASRALRYAYGPLSYHHVKFFLLQTIGLYYYYYFKNILLFLLGDNLVNALRKRRRMLFSGKAGRTMPRPLK